MPKNQESFEFDVFDFLNVSPVTKIIKKRVYINFITIPTKGQLKKHNLFSSKDVKIGETFSDQENIYYYKIIDDFYQDPIEEMSCTEGIRGSYPPEHRSDKPRHLRRRICCP